MNDNLLLDSLYVDCQLTAKKMAVLFFCSLFFFFFFELIISVLIRGSQNTKKVF